MEYPFVEEHQQSLTCYLQMTLCCSARATHNEVEAIVDVLQVYAKALGQSINLEKSSMYFSGNTPCDKKEEIMGTLGSKRWRGLSHIWGCLYSLGVQSTKIFLF